MGSKEKNALACFFAYFILSVCVNSPKQYDVFVGSTDDYYRIIDRKSNFAQAIRDNM